MLSGVFRPVTPGCAHYNQSSTYWNKKRTLPGRKYSQKPYRRWSEDNDDDRSNKPVIGGSALRQRAEISQFRNIPPLLAEAVEKLCPEAVLTVRYSYKRAFSPASS
tara:strand:- start:2205 stop:2522 length:318 start_codon:yes stop_codon:yes gene_type:complete